MDPQRLLRCLRLLEEIPLKYMVTGSIAAILYGKPRLTHDMDLVVVFPHNKIAPFLQRFDTQEFYCPPPEVIEAEIHRGDTGHMNVIDQLSGFKIDLYPFAHDALVAWGLAHRKHIALLPEEPVWVAPPEYVIVKKLLYYREGGSDKHVEDIRAILDVSSDEVSLPEVVQWVKKLSLDLEWQKVSGP